MSQRRSYVASAKLGGLIYAAGGMVGETGRFLRTFARYDPRRDRWTTLAPLPEPVRAGAGAALGGRVYVIGGATPSGGGRQVFAYDVRAGTWESRAPVPEPVFNHAAVAYRGRILVLGGYHRGRERATVFSYDPARDRWTRGPPLPRAQHAFAAVVHDGDVWAIGGRRGERVLRSVWVLDGRRWRAGPTLPKPMELLGADVRRGQIHAIWEGTYAVWTGRRWRLDRPPRVLRHALSVFAVGGRLYVVGGCTVELHDTQLVESRPLP